MVLSGLFRRSPLIWKIRRKLSSSGYSVVRPGIVGPPRPVPDRVVKPSYALSGDVPPSPLEPEIKTESQIEGVRNACKLARHILDLAGRSVKVGMTTDDIDKIVHTECIANNAYPSPLMYKGFPKSVCTSVNNVLCHGIPDNRPLENGDIVNIDVTVYFYGYHGDTSETFAVGEVNDAGKQLLMIGKECLKRGISVCKPGARFIDIGEAISEHASGQGFAVIPNIIGHGIGSYFHGPPDIYHIPYETSDSIKTMQPGMTFTIEPIISEGSDRFETLDDGWTLVSVDNSRSSQFEHTVLITSRGVEVMTQWYCQDYGEI